MRVIWMAVADFVHSLWRVYGSAMFNVIGLRHEDSGDRREYIPVGLVCGIHAADVPSIFMANPSSKFNACSFSELNTL